jgi:pimeloyl-ACP methyl ester carboxylesterase
MQDRRQLLLTAAAAAAAAATTATAQPAPPVPKPRMLKVTQSFTERPQSAWGTIATEFLGCQTRYVKGERFTHRIVEKGNGPPLFMYHGVGGHLETYARTLPALSRDFHVIAVDALYHGYSSKEPWDSDRRTQLQAEAYVDLLHALGYKKAHYEGESMGATIGCEIALRFPETVDKLILNGFMEMQTKRTQWQKQPFKGDLGELSRAAVADPSYANIHKRLLWLVHTDSTITEEMIKLRQRLYQDPKVNASLRRVFNMDGGQPSRAVRRTEDEVKAAWKSNTLVLYGEFNPQRGPDYGAYCAELVGGQFYEFKGAGHWPQWEMPDEYVAVMRSFLLA